MRFLLLLIVTGLAAACQETPTPNISSGERSIDGLSRNVSQNQGGAVRDPYSISPPPVRPEFVQDR